MNRRKENSKSRRERDLFQKQRTVPRRARYDVRHLRLCGVLSESSEEVAEHLTRDGTCALLIEEREGFFVLW